MFNNDKHDLVNKFVKTLTERAEQHGGGLSYALNYVYSLLMDMDLNAENWRHIKRETVTLQTLIDITEQEKIKNTKNDNWVPACGGTEIPFKSRSGKRLQYVWQPSTGQHAYLDVDSDIILSDEEAQACLQMH
jgi:hypothetical protein